MDTPSLSRVSFRTKVLYGIIILVGLIFIARLFHLQIIRHDYYTQLALEEQVSKFVIPASRGVVYAFDGTAKVPLVLNESLPTLFADPQGIQNPERTAEVLSDILGIKKSKILPKLSGESRYQVIARKVSKKKATAIEIANLDGIGFTEASYRAYPQAGLASQALGFVNTDGQGQYGLEEYLNETLAGQDGRLRAVTDVYGIPLSTLEDAVEVKPIPGQDITLTLDINIQKKVEEALQAGMKRSGGKTGSAIVMDPYTGAIKAMANYPTYDSSKYEKVSDYNRFFNPVVSRAYEAGSVMKVLTMATGLNEGVVTPRTTYQDNGFVTIDGIEIENAGGGAGGQRTMTEVIQRSVNTGVIYVLQQLGGGSINNRGKSTLFDYYTNQFGLGSITGIAQANEAAGTVSAPGESAGDNIRYANMTYGQGMTVTMLQMAAALSSIVNGGSYYQPYLVHSQVDENGNEVVSDPQVIRDEIISSKISKDIMRMMLTVVQNGGGYSARKAGYAIGGKTGSAQVIDESTGEYSEYREMGSFLGYVGQSINNPKYVIMTRVEEPTIPGYAGTVAAAPIFAEISHWLIDYEQIPPN